MTFDLTPEQESRLAAVRRLAADTLAPAAADLDADGTIPPPLAAALDAAGVWQSTTFDAVLVIEELAAASAAAAARAAFGAEAAGRQGLSGLRGIAPLGAPTPEQQLAMAAICLGIGRAALEEGVAEAKRRGDRPSGEPGDPPHWVLADAATDMDAARLLVQAAAQGNGVGPAASLVFAGAAATRAVEAAMRIAGADALRTGSVIERCARDVRAAVLLLGTEDTARGQAADTLLR